MRFHEIFKTVVWMDYHVGAKAVKKIENRKLKSHGIVEDTHCKVTRKCPLTGGGEGYLPKHLNGIKSKSISESINKELYY